MIKFFWVKSEYIMSSYWPDLYNELSKLSESCEVIDVSDFSDTDSIKFNDEDIIVIDHSIISSLNEKSNKTEPDLTRKKNLNIKNLTTIFNYLLFNCNPYKKGFFYFGDLHAIKEPFEKRFDSLGIENYYNILKNIDFWIWGFDFDSLPYFADIKIEYFTNWENSWIHDDVKNIASEIIKSVKTTIQIPYSVRKEEILTPTKKYKYDISVVGVPYSTRGIALNSLSPKHKIAPYLKLKKRTDYFLYQIYKLIKLISIKNYNKIKKYFYKKLQNEIVSNSFASFVCGGTLMYTVRKFYEIPACGSLLIGYAPNELKDLGFENEKNYIYSIPENLNTNLEKALLNKKNSIEIMNNGQKLILEKHTTEKRAEQLIFALQKLQEGDYKVAKFKDGEFQIF